MSVGLDSINWAKHELLPAIAQDIESGEVLMLAYMNQEALSLTRQTRIAHYFSRSKGRIWQKGESSGHTQEVREIFLDCDNDTILLKVKQCGVACHTGNHSCFFTRVEFCDSYSLDKTSEKSKHDVSAIYGVVDTLYHEILERKHASREESYTAKLFSKGENTIGKKIVEEAAELSFAIKDNDKHEIIYEAADLLYHALVGLAYSDINPDMVRQELVRRRGVSGIVEKNSRKDS